MRTLFSVVFIFNLTVLLAQNCKDTSVIYKFPGVKKINYPKPALDANIQGNVLVQFDVDSTCSLVNRKIVKGIGYGCDEEAIRALDQVEMYFKSEHNSKCCPVKGTMLPIRFRLK